MGKLVLIEGDDPETDYLLDGEKKDGLGGVKCGLYLVLAVLGFVAIFAHGGDGEEAKNTNYKEENQLHVKEYVFDTESLNSTSIAVGDFDGDGVDEIAVGSSFGLTIFFNHGPRVVHTELDWLSVAAADFNGDQRTDLAAIVLDRDQDEKQVRLLLTGPSSLLKETSTIFAHQEILISETSASVLAVADMDSDGDIDILMASHSRLSWFENAVLWPEHMIDSEVQGPTVLSVSSSPKEKKNNVYLADSSSRLFRFVDNKKGWTKSTVTNTGVDSSRLSTLDINTHGLVLATAHEAGLCFVFEVNNENHDLVIPTTGITAAVWWQQAAPETKKKDLIAIGSNDGLSVYDDRGRLQLELKEGDPVHFLVQGHFDKDHTLDLAAVYQSGTVAWYTSTRRKGAVTHHHHRSKNDDEIVVEASSASLCEAQCTIPLTIRVLTNANPLDTSWRLTSAFDSACPLDVQSGSLHEANAFHLSSALLCPHQTYTFTIFDAAGAGLSGLHSHRSGNTSSGGYSLTLDGQPLPHSSSFEYQQSTHIVTPKR